MNYIDINIDNIKGKLFFTYRIFCIGGIHIYCPSCGEKVNEDDKYCYNCGAELSMSNDNKNDNEEKSKSKKYNDLLESDGSNSPVNQNNNFDYKKILKKILLILAGIFIPVIGQILVIRSKRFKKTGKIIAGIWLAVFIIALSRARFIPEDNDQTSNNVKQEEKITDNTSEQVSNDVEQNEQVDKQKSEKENIQVKLNIDHKISQQNKVKIIVESNLPDDTNLLVTLSNDKYDYTAQDSFKLFNGKGETDWFSSKGRSLKGGNYSVDITMPLAHTQTSSVQKIIGEKGGNLTGKYVEEDDLGKVARKTKQIEVPSIKNETPAFSIDYEITSKEDLSMKAMGDKSLSDFTTNEIENLPVNKKINYNIVVGKDIKSEQVRPFITNFINRKIKENNDIDEIGLFLYSTKNRTNGAYDIARAIWSTNGDWGGITPKIARENIRDNHEIFIETRDNLEDYLDNISKTEDKFNLSEEKRKEIYRELVLCEDKAMIEADKHYSSRCSECPEFIENDLDKRGNMRNRLIKKYEEDVREEYNITKEQQEEISLEGMKKNWPMPDMLPYPDCCDY